LCRSYFEADVDEKVAEAADQWLLNLIAKGFEEIA